MFLSDKGAALLASQDKRVREHETKVEDSYGNEDAPQAGVLPTPLKAPILCPRLKLCCDFCARNLYGWQCDHETLEATN
ncbi:hypothetical protein D9M68_478160 [compost metagenome]